MVVEDEFRHQESDGSRVSHSVSVNTLGPAHSMPEAADTLALNDALRAVDALCEADLACDDAKTDFERCQTWAKISLSDVDNIRGLRADDHRFRFQQRDHRLRLCAAGGECTGQLRRAGR